MREAFLDALPPDVPGPDPGALGLPLRRSRGAAGVRRADGAPARAGDGRVLPQHGGGPAIDVARGARAVPRHARRAERDDRASRAGRALRLRRVHAAVRRPVPRQPEDARRAARADGGADGRDVAAARLDVAGAARRAPGAGGAGHAGHGPRVRGRPARREPRLDVPRDAVGRPDARREATSRCRCRRRWTRWSACTTIEELDRSLRGDYAGASHRGRRRGDAASHARRGGRPRPAPAEGDRARAGARRPRVERWGAGSRSRRRALGSSGSGRSCACSRSSGATARARTRRGTRAASSEPTGATRPWRFGDAGQIAVQRTVFNAVLRGRSRRAACGSTPDDFELVEAEQRTETATALLLDLSFSMPLRGHFVHAKRMALALHALIEGRYPHDTLYMIGFSDYARQMEPDGPDRGRLGAHVRDEHAARVPPRRPAARAASEGDAAGDHGHRRGADGAPRGRRADLLVAADPGDDAAHPRRGHAARQGGRHAERLHARGVAGAGPVHGAAGRADARADLPDGRRREIGEFVVRDYVTRRER